MLLCYLVGVSLLQYTYLYNIRLVIVRLRTICILILPQSDVCWCQQTLCYSWHHSGTHIIPAAHVMTKPRLTLTRLANSRNTCILWWWQYQTVRYKLALALPVYGHKGGYYKKQGCHLTWALMAASCRVATRISFRLRHMSSCVSYTFAYWCFARLLGQEREKEGERKVEVVTSQEEAQDVVI